MEANPRQKDWKKIFEHWKSTKKTTLSWDDIEEDSIRLNFNDTEQLSLIYPIEEGSYFFLSSPLTWQNDVNSFILSSPNTTFPQILDKINFYVEREKFKKSIEISEDVETDDNDNDNDGLSSEEHILTSLTKKEIEVLSKHVEKAQASLGEGTIDFSDNSGCVTISLNIQDLLASNWLDRLQLLKEKLKINLLFTSNNIVQISVGQVNNESNKSWGLKFHIPHIVDSFFNDWGKIRQKKIKKESASSLFEFKTNMEREIKEKANISVSNPTESASNSQQVASPPKPKKKKKKKNVQTSH